MIAMTAFVVFIALVVLGVWALLRSDTNTPDTELSLVIEKATRRMGELYVELGEQMLAPMRAANAALADFAAKFGESLRDASPYVQRWWW